MAAEFHLLLRVTVFVDVGVLFSGLCVVDFFARCVCGVRPCRMDVSVDAHVAQNFRFGHRR